MIRSTKSIFLNSHFHGLDLSTWWVILMIGMLQQRLRCKNMELGGRLNLFCRRANTVMDSKYADVFLKIRKLIFLAGILDGQGAVLSAK